MMGHFKLRIATDKCDEALRWHLKREVEARGRKFIQNEEQLKSLSEISEWLCKPTSTFGLTLLGVMGNGKTTFVKAIRGLINSLKLPDPNTSSTSSAFAGVWLVTARDLYGKFVDSPAQFNCCRETYILAIDEFGTEETEYVRYGNRYKPIEELLSYRYDRMLPTIITTNLPSAAIRGKYGDRLAERLNEMMQVIHMPDVNFRIGK